MNTTSSVIAAIDYNPVTLVLRITLRNRSVYDYQGVPEYVAKQFLSAPSKGRYYNQYIKGKYQSVEVLSPL